MLAVITKTAPVNARELDWKISEGRNAD